MALVGNTIKIRAEFPNTIPNLDSMTGLQLNIYTEDDKLVSTSTNVTKVSTGVYEALYTVTNKLFPAILIAEIKGIIGTYPYMGRIQLLRTSS